MKTGPNQALEPTRTDRSRSGSVDSRAGHL